MKHVLIYENFSQNKEMILVSRQNREIRVSIEGGRIISIDNQSGVRFPWEVGQSVNRSIETWACNNGFTLNGKDPCPEEKIFGIKVSQIPQGHEWRTIFPNKFRK